jgi:hypothetical protein
MSNPLTLEDSPLSIIASVAGILTFFSAIIVSVLGYVYLLRSSSPESVSRFYQAFSACALETDLVRRDILQLTQSPNLTTGLAEHFAFVNLGQKVSSQTLDGTSDQPHLGDNYLLDPDSLGKLYEQVRAVEIELQDRAAKVVYTRPTEDSTGLWSRILGRSRWASRAKELDESLAKREKLTARLLVIQMSLMAA